MSDLARLQRVLGYEFADTELLSLALAHRSMGRKNNERLEFLGDSIVNHVIAEALFQQFPEAREGELSRLRASLVRGETLADLARELGLGEYLRLGPGELKSGGHRRSSILANALEALAGAILLDSDTESCRSCLLRWFQPRLAQLNDKLPKKDAKTRLQEYLQGQQRPLPVYSLVTVSGDDHKQVFQVECRMRKPDSSVQGSGGSRRRAEQAAALAALKELQSDD